MNLIDANTKAVLQSAFDDLHQTFEIINRPRTGTLAGANQIIFGTDALLKQSNGILNHEERQLSTLDTQELGIFNNFQSILKKSDDMVDKLNGTATAATNTLNATTQTLAIINDKDNGIGVTISNANKTINDVDFFTNDPHVHAFINNLDPMSKNMTTITGNFADSTGDFKTRFHEWLYPTPCKTFKCKMGKAIIFVSDASKFTEPAYYAEQLLTGK